MITSTATGWGILGHFPDHSDGPWKLLGRWFNFGVEDPAELSGYKTAVFRTRAAAREAAKNVTNPRRVVKVRVTVEVL